MRIAIALFLACQCAAGVSGQAFQVKPHHQRGVQATPVVEGPTKPLSEATAAQWVQELIDHFYSHPITTHPLMGKLADGSFPDHVGAVAFFAHQIFAFARDFRAVCGIVTGKLRCCDDVRDNLVYHLAEENGRYPETDVAFLESKGVKADLIVGKPHIDLWGSLLEKLGISTSGGFIPEAEALDMWMINHVRANSATSGAVMIMAIELWSKDMGKDMLPALTKAGLSREDAVFFELHDVIDDEIHVADIGKDLMSLVMNQNLENTLDELKASLTSFQDTRLKLWEVLYAKFMSMPAVGGAAPVAVASNANRNPLDESTAAQWVQELIDHFYSHPITTHPLMGKLADGSFPDHVGAVAFFAHQIFAFARDFRAVCGIVTGKLRCCDDVRDNLVYHLAEENGRYPETDVAFLESKGVKADLIVGKPHIDLWGSLLEKLGISTSGGFIPEAEALDMWMINHVRANSATSGAVMIMAIELWSKDMGKDMLPALTKAGLSREDAVFFELHDVIDDEIHVADIGKDLMSLVMNQNLENTLDELKASLTSFQDTRLKLWEVLYAKFMSMPAVGGAAAAAPKIAPAATSAAPPVNETEPAAPYNPWNTASPEKKMKPSAITRSPTHRGEGLSAKIDVTPLGYHRANAEMNWAQLAK